MTDPFGAENLIPRDQWERPLIQPPGGGTPEPYMRASTLAGLLKDSTGIGTWKARHVAQGIARNPDLRAIAAGAEYGSSALDDVIDRALDRVGLNEKSDYGTAIHAFTETPDPPHVPASMLPDVQAYQRVLSAARIETVATEVFVVHDKLRAAGTLDHVYRVPAEHWPTGINPGDGLVVGDKKTGTLHPQDHAVQLAVYAGGSAYDPETGKRTYMASPLDNAVRPGVSQDVAVLVHIPRGEATARLLWVNIREGLEAAFIARDFVDVWRKRKDLAIDFTPLAATPEEPSTLAWDAVGRSVIDARQALLADAIGRAVSEIALNALWRTSKDIWTDDHTMLAKARRAMIEGGLV